MNTPIPRWEAIFAIVMTAIVSFALGRMPHEPMASPVEIAMGVAEHEHEHPRSKDWPKVRAAHLREHPNCEACGGPADQVHHIVSFSVAPHRELDRSNLVSLCTKSRFGMNDHFTFGHGGNWKCRNENVVRDARQFRAMIEGRLCNEVREPAQ